jgi:hypothetical protein
MDALREKIEAWTGNQAAIADLSKAELSKLREQERPIIGELRTDAIIVGGSDLTALLDAA